MRNKILVLLLFLSQFVFSQENQKWSGYFSYNNIKDVSQSNTQVYAVAQNAYFKRDNTTNQISTFSSVEGLSGQNISQIYYSSTFKKTLVGHSDGLLIIVNEDDGSVLNVVDILNKPSIPPNKKKINHFLEFEGKIYISTDFGIVVFNLNTLQFGDTYFVGPSGSNIEILQTAVYQGSIYAVANGLGILKASVVNPNLIDFNQWIVAFPGSWLAVEAFGENLLAIGGDSLNRLEGGLPSVVGSFTEQPVDLRNSENNLIVTTRSSVYLYDKQLQQISQINNIPNVASNYTCASKIGNKIYIGTSENGLVSTTISNPTVFENVTPDGPDRNRVFAIKSSANNLWIAYGDYDIFYNPYPTLDSFGVTKYESNKLWKHVPYEKLFDAKSISRIIINPNNENEVYFSSHYSGLLKFENDIPKTIYNTSNSSLQTIAGQPRDDVRVNGTAFDKKGGLWMTNSQVNSSLHVINKEGQWQGYSLNCLLSSTSFGAIDIDKNETKWIASTNGVVGFNEKNNKCIVIGEEKGNGNLPSNSVRVVVVDNKNKLWIGTTKGLRVLSSVDSFLNQNRLETNSIIILDDGLAQELLFEQTITDIVVDGANNKWIGTLGSGVFYISPDGQKTFNIFTKENSPLPSNVINDIDINNVTGEVFIATDGGLVSYKGDATKGTENLNNVIIYPNPVRPEYSGMVNITGLMNKSNVKVTDIEGNLVYEGISEGGTVQWNADAFGKYKVASGVYMVFVSSEDGAETTVKKVMVIR